MRHRVAHRKLGRTTPHRIALLRNLATALFDKERIRTTLGKAKELRPFAERLITLAKKDDGRLHARRLVLRDVQDPVIVKKLFDTLAARFATRPGGYTRLLKLGSRQGDGAEVAIVELVGSEFKPGKKDSASKADAGKKSEPAADEKATDKSGKAEKKAAAGKKKAAARTEAEKKPKSGQENDAE